MKSRRFHIAQRCSNDLELVTGRWIYRILKVETDRGRWMIMLVSLFS